MKYFLLCALLISGAFFSYPLMANPERCPQGTYQVIDGIEMCTIPAPYGSTYKCEAGGLDFGRVKTLNECATKVQPTTQKPETTYCHDIEPFYGPISDLEISVGWRFRYAWPNGDCYGNYMHYAPTIAKLVDHQEGHHCPPDNNPSFLNTYPTGNSFVCWKNAEPIPQCDCANFAGDSLKTNNDLLAPEGQYTETNPPQCVRQSEIAAGRDTPLECVCQVSAQKWAWSYAGFNAETNTQMVRWQTRPTQIGQPSGTFTGVKCGSEDGGPLEPENDAPKDCFTLKNGVKWCWADKAEKCQVVNGVEQCASGCGTVNGDFVCYEDTPVIPPKDRDQLTPPDDTLTDPGKSINDMVKGDFKEINKGVESRLDNVVTSITNSTIAMDEVSDKVGLTNSKLDGIGMQLDGIGKQLGDIDGTLEGAFGDDGEPQPGTGDGETCYEDICSWYESAYPDGLVGIWQERSSNLQQTPLFNFLNQLGTVQPTGGQPDFNICFNLGAMGDYGCKSFEIPSAVWAFIRLMILICAGIFCYRIVSGV